MVKQLFYVITPDTQLKKGTCLMADLPSNNDLVQRVRELEDENASIRTELVQLQRSDHKLRMMIDNIPDMIWLMSADKFQLNYLSPSVESLIGYTVKEALSRPFSDIITPASYEYAEKHFKRLVRQIETDLSKTPKMHTLELEYVRKDGSTVWLEITAMPIFDGTGKFVEIIGASRDISKRIDAEKALKKSEEKFRNIFKTSRDTIYITSRDGKIIEMNPAGAELFGYLHDEIIGSDILNIYHDPADRDRFKKIIEEKGYVRDYEIKFQKKDGAQIDCLLTSTTWRSDNGDILGYQGIIRDITDQKRMLGQLQQVQKMEAIGTLAGGIAHNFNNLLMTIQGNTSLMLMKTDPGHPHYKKLKIIEEHIQYGSDLSRQLLGFARGGQYQSNTINLNVIVRMSAKIFASTKKELSLHSDLQKNLAAVNADPGQMEQVVLNLLINASQAMPDGGEIYIRTENVDLAEFQVAPYQKKPGQYVKLSITDTGIGMDEKTQEKIFEPFFTTKEQGQGTGLGLSSVYGIVKNHGGYISVYSEPGEGSTFKIFLPVSRKTPEKKDKIAEPLLRGSESILIIDDESMIIETGATLLAELGYTVLTADGGKEALNIYAARQQQIDMVILDMIMPKMSGRETFEQLKNINPEVKVLLSSGYSINGQASDLLKQGCRGFIQKPFNISKLSKKVREVIENKNV